MHRSGGGPKTIFKKDRFAMKMYMPWGGNTPPLKTGVMAYPSSTATLLLLQASRLYITTL